MGTQGFDFLVGPVSLIKASMEKGLGTGFIPSLVLMGLNMESVVDMSMVTISLWITLTRKMSH